MFAHDLCHSRIEYLRYSIDFNRKDRAKRYHKSSIINRQSSIPALPVWGLSFSLQDRFVKKKMRMGKQSNALMIEKT